MFHFEPGRCSKGDRQTETRIRMHIIIFNDANDSEEKAKQLKKIHLKLRIETETCSKFEKRLYEFRSK